MFGTSANDISLANTECINAFTPHKTYVVLMYSNEYAHADVIKWKHFPRYWPFVWGIHRSPVNSPHKGRWRGVLMLSLICDWINDSVNNHEAGDLRRHRVHYDVIVMTRFVLCCAFLWFDSDWSYYLRATNANLSDMGKLFTWNYMYRQTSNISCTLVGNKQRVLMHRHQGWNVRHGLCHIYMRYLYIYELFIAFVCFVVCSLL